MHFKPEKNDNKKLKFYFKKIILRKDCIKLFKILKKLNKVLINVSWNEKIRL